MLPQIREYYRLSTTVINAYLQPILARYIAQLDRRLAGAGIATRQKYIMQSNGGMATFAAAARRAVTTVLSGPAGGVTAGVLACGMSGSANIITFDMGGTSCDVALIRDGEPLLSSRGKIEGRDLAVPMLDINTVSAGGGTVATVDRFGVLQVGPQSAGAVPGPACYGRGGEAPTITDCNLVLGYLGEDNFLGGRMRLDAAKARAAIEAAVAEPLGLDVAEAAEGIVRVIDVKMEEAIKAISTMRGHDLRDFMLLAFGGAGPLHAGRIARDLGMAGVIVPLYPGVFSAIGLLMSDVKHDYIRSKLTPLSEVTPADVNGMFERMVAQALEELRDDGFCGRSHPHRARARYALCRSGIRDRRPLPRPAAAGSGFETAPRHLRPTAPERCSATWRREEPVEIVSYRVRGIGLVPPVEMPKFKPAGTTLGGCAARDAARALRWQGARLPGLSARAARCRLDGRRTGDPRPVRLHDRDLPRPDGARG